MSFDPPLRCALKRRFPPTLLARSSVQEDATPRRRRLLPGTFCQILVDGRPGSWLSARRPFLVLPRSLHGKLLLANWWSDFTTSYAFSGLDPHTIASPCTDSNDNEQTIEASWNQSKRSRTMGMNLFSKLVETVVAKCLTHTKNEE